MSKTNKVEGSLLYKVLEGIVCAHYKGAMSLMRFSFVTVILAAMLVQGASDIYTPSLPHIAKDFGTTLNMVQWSLAIYMAGVALTQLIYGPLSEVFGRRHTMIFGVGIFFIGSCVCALSTNIEMLLMGRLIQGLGAGAPSGLWRATFRDIYHGPQLAVYASYLTIIISIVFPMAPALGGYLETAFGWQANFYFMLFYSIVTLLVLIFGFQETNKNLLSKAPNLWKVLSVYRVLLCNSIFSGSTFLTFLAYGGMVASVTVAPVLFIHIQGFTPLEFGWTLCLSSGVSLGLAGWTNGLLVSKLGINRMMCIGLFITGLSGAILSGGYLLLGFNTPSMVIFLSSLYFGLGFIMPNAYAKAFSSLTENIGYASALYSFIQISGGAMIGALSSYVPDQTPLPLAAIIMGCSIVGFFVFFSVIKKP